MIFANSLARAMPVAGRGVRGLNTAQIICASGRGHYIATMKILRWTLFTFAALAAGCWLTGCENPAAMNASTANVKHITQSEFAANVTDSTNAAVVDFYATWCGPCRMLAPVMEKQADTFAGKIKFYKVNVDESPALAKDYKVQAIPTVLFFKDGKLTYRVVGLLSEADLKAKLDELAAAK
jgi:thioredoxin 1